MEFNTGSLRKTLFSRTPGNVQVVPPLVVYPQPPCRKSDVTLLNCLQPITILLRFVGSTAIDGSFAASPRMLFPLASTLTWKLVNGPYCEIIRGEVSIRKRYAGGMLYFSSGSVGSGLCGAVWPEAMDTKNSESRQVKTLAINILKRIIVRNSLCERSRIRASGRRPSRQKKELATQTFRGVVRRKSKCPALIALSVALRKRVGSPAARRCGARPLSICTHRLS